MDRKDFFSNALKYSLGKSLSFLTSNPILKFLEDLAEPKQRPPGALPEQDFLNTCTGCDACMEACPPNVIMIEDLEKRHPLIYPEQAPCLHCDGYPCISVCPTGALNNTSPKNLRIL
jgi:ferredoxin